MALAVQNTLELISNIKTVLKYEILPIENCLSRICASQIIATSFLPKYNNSAMDGYAIIYEEKKEELEIIDTIFAGDNNNTLIEKNTCIKIMTGAK
ncbi:MAG: molybdopterin molybdenumtransferase MoeA, partial [Arcobacter sp.]|nr:molybdopterin molybdenumtransferase MoeA [Arcobacter sp.]